MWRKSISYSERLRALQAELSSEPRVQSQKRDIEVVSDFDEGSTHSYNESSDSKRSRIQNFLKQNKNSDDDSWWRYL
ncbi:MAG: hypothetical protein QXI16_03255 [Sulfolobaceae archaeon]